MFEEQQRFVWLFAQTRVTDAFAEALWDWKKKIDEGGFQWEAAKNRKH